MSKKLSDKGCGFTRLSLLWMNLSGEPLVALFTCLPFILRSEIGASTFQLALYTALNPVLAVFSFYWGAHLSHRKNTLLPNLISAWVLARLPFLFFPFFKSFWFFFGAAAIYQLFNRAVAPALMEILRRNIPKRPRERLFSLYFIVSVIEGVGLGLLFTYVLKIGEGNWPLFFFVSGMLGLSALFIQMRIPLETQDDEPKVKHRPLKACFNLLKERPDFAHFQWCFMIGGLSLMMLAPVRSIFAADTLSLSISAVTTARLVFVGLGLSASSILWQRALEKWGIQNTTYAILVGFGLFPLVLLLAPLHLYFFFFSHLVYGVAQGGSHLVWHLSGPIFSADDESSLYTTVNILMVGLRGLIGPFLGGLLCDLFGPTFVLISGSLLAFGGMWWLKTREARLARA